MSEEPEDFEAMEDRDPVAFVVTGGDELGFPHPAGGFDIPADDDVTVVVVVAGVGLPQPGGGLLTPREGVDDEDDDDDGLPHPGGGFMTPGVDVWEVDDDF